MSTTFSESTRLATLQLGEQTVDGVSITVTEGETEGQFIATAKTGSNGSNLSFRPGSNVHKGSAYEAYTDEASSSDTTTYKETQWNISVNGDANNAFHFYRTSDTDSSTDKNGPEIVSFGAGNDSVFGLSVTSDATTVNGGDGDNQYYYGDPTYEYSGSPVGQHAGGDADYWSSANNGEATRDVTIIDGKGNSYAEVTGTWTAQMGLGADTVYVNTEGREGTFNWTDYAAAEGDVLQMSQGALDVTNLTSLEANLKSSGEILLGANADGTSAVDAVLNLTDKSNFRALLQNVGGATASEVVDVWYAGTKASVMDAEAMDHSVVMISNNNENEGDSMRGGAKGDILIGGQNDTLNGGVGDDTIYLGTSNTEAGVDGQRETVVIDTLGDKDLVFNFDTGLSDTSDVVHVAHNYRTLRSITSDGTDITVTAQDGSTLTLEDVGQNQSRRIQSFLLSNGDDAETLRTLVVQSDQTGYVDDSDGYDTYFGSNSTLDFSKSEGVNDNLAVDLGNTGKYYSKSYFNGIVAVYGMNADNNTLVGAAGANNTLAAGANSYHNSIWGGGRGRDYIIADEGAEDTIFYGAGDDMDTVKGFITSEDRIFVHSGTVGSTKRSSATQDIIQFNWDENNVLTVVTDNKDVDSAIAYTLNGTDNRGIKVGLSDASNTFTYEEGVDAYFGGAQGDTLNVSTSANKNIWLDGRTGAVNTKGIETLNASGSSGNLQLAGDAASNEIIGGAGQNSIWGGDGNVTDTLQGGSGKNTFYFGTGEGADVITSYNDGDKVMLYNVTESSISSAALSGEDMVINLTDGSKLTIQNYSGSGSMTFQLADATYLYDKDQNTWAKQD